MKKLFVIFSVILFTTGCSVINNNEEYKDPFSFKSKELVFSGYTYLDVEENSFDIYGFKEREGLNIRIITEEPFRGEGDYNISIVRISDGIAPDDGPLTIAEGVNNTNSKLTVHSIDNDIISASFEGEYKYISGEKSGKNSYAKATFELKEGEYLGIKK